MSVAALAQTIISMAEAGCSPQQMANVAASFLAREEDAAIARREKERNKKRAQRAKNAEMSLGTSRDIEGQGGTSRDILGQNESIEPSRAEYNTTRADALIPNGISYEIPSLVNSHLPSGDLPSSALETAAPRKASRAKPRTTIAEDAQPSDRDRAASEAAGLSMDDFRAEWRKFRDHHLSRGSRMADWSAAWRTWLGNVGQFSRARAGPQDAPYGTFCGKPVHPLAALALGISPNEQDRRDQQSETIEGFLRITG